VSIGQPLPLANGISLSRPAASLRRCCLLVLRRASLGCLRACSYRCELLALASSLLSSNFTQKELKTTAYL
jgi:hypothetical protein